MYTYSDPSRENDQHAIPDVEIFEINDAVEYVEDENGEQYENGWYWQSCFPGCLPDSPPFGPFGTAEEAIADAQSW